MDSAWHPNGTVDNYGMGQIAPWTSPLLLEGSEVERTAAEALVSTRRTYVIVGRLALPSTLRGLAGVFVSCRALMSRLSQSASG
jgi:hypothetical protein